MCSNSNIGLFQSSGDEKSNLFGSETVNDGIADLLIRELFLEMGKSKGHYETSCLVSELRDHELKRVPSEDDELPQGSFFSKCDTAKSVFELLKAAKNSDSTTSFIITLKVKDLENNTCGFFRIFLLPENEKEMQSGASVAALSSLERVFMQGYARDESEENTDNEILSEILRSTVGYSNTCLIVSVSSQVHYPHLITRKLRLGSAVYTDYTVETDTFILDPVLTEGNTLDFNDLSGSQLSLRASMINSSIIKFNVGEEDCPQNLFSPEKCIPSQGRDSPQIQSEILLNLGKHLFEDADQLYGTVLNDNKCESAEKSTSFMAICMSVTSTMFAVFFAVLFINTKMTKVSVYDTSCSPPELVTNTTVNLNVGHFETSRQIIGFVQEVDQFFSYPEYSPTTLNYFLVTAGFALLILASLMFSMFSVFLWIASIVGGKLKKKKTKTVPKRKHAGNSSRKSMSSEHKKINMKNESPYMKHPRIMSPIDTSKIFMSRYTGTVVMNNGIIADVVRSSRIGTPSPSKYGTPLSCEKLVKSTPIVLQAVKEEDQCQEDQCQE